MPRTKCDIECECGGRYSDTTKEKHEETARHKKYLTHGAPKKRDGRNEDYYEDGKFAPNKYYHANKEKYNNNKLEKCECGRIVLARTMSIHKQKPIHKRAMEFN